jgi:hypothetical protein
MVLELEPPQPDPVADAVEHLLATVESIDPWWASGLEEALRGDDGAPAEHAWGGTRVVEP